MANQVAVTSQPQPADPTILELTDTAAGTVTLRMSRDGFQTRTQALSWGNAFPIDIPFWLNTLEPPIGLDPASTR
jgi:hypothetical protein